MAAEAKKQEVRARVEELVLSLSVRRSEVKGMEKELEGLLFPDKPGTSPSRKEERSTVSATVRKHLTENPDRGFSRSDLLEMLKGSVDGMTSFNDLGAALDDALNSMRKSKTDPVYATGDGRRRIYSITSPTVKTKKKAKGAVKTKSQTNGEIKIGSDGRRLQTDEQLREAIVRYLNANRSAAASTIYSSVGGMGERVTALLKAMTKEGLLVYGQVEVVNAAGRNIKSMHYSLAS